MENSNNKTSIESKTVFITGGTSGIGEFTAKYLSSKGMNVIIFGRSEENGKRIEKEINELNFGKCLFQKGDVTSEEDQRKALEEGEKQFGAIHFAFANAGIGGSGGILSTNLKEFKNYFEINFFGSLITLQQITPFFKKVGAGVIVFNSSLSSLYPRSYFKEQDFCSAYAISKSSLDSLVKTATSLEKSHNIKAFSVNPTCFLSGLTQIPNINPDHIAQKFNLIVKKIGNPKDIGKVLEHLFDGTTKYFSGQGIVVENEFTIPSQYFYDIYSTESVIDPKNIIYNHLRDSSGDKLNEKQIFQLEERIQKIEEEFKNQTNTLQFN